MPIQQTLDELCAALERASNYGGNGLEELQAIIGQILVKCRQVSEQLPKGKHSDILDYCVPLYQLTEKMDLPKAHRFKSTNSNVHFDNQTKKLTAYVADKALDLTRTRQIISLMADMQDSQLGDAKRQKAQTDALQLADHYKDSLANFDEIKALLQEHYPDIDLKQNYETELSFAVQLKKAIEKCYLGQLRHKPVAEHVAERPKPKSAPKVKIKPMPVAEQQQEEERAPVEANKTVAAKPEPKSKPSLQEQTSPRRRQLRRSGSVKHKPDAVMVKLANDLIKLRDYQGDKLSDVNALLQAIDGHIQQLQTWLPMPPLDPDQKALYTDLSGPFNATMQSDIKLRATAHREYFFRGVVSYISPIKEASVDAVHARAIVANLAEIRKVSVTAQRKEQLMHDSQQLAQHFHHCVHARPVIDLFKTADPDFSARGENTQLFVKDIERYIEREYLHFVKPKRSKQEEAKKEEVLVERKPRLVSLVEQLQAALKSEGLEVKATGSQPEIGDFPVEQRAAVDNIILLLQQLAEDNQGAVLKVQGLISQLDQQVTALGVLADGDDINMVNLIGYFNQHSGRKEKLPATTKHDHMLQEMKVYVAPVCAKAEDLAIAQRIGQLVTLIADDEVGVPGKEKAHDEALLLADELRQSDYLDDIKATIQSAVEAIATSKPEYNSLLLDDIKIEEYVMNLKEQLEIRFIDEIVQLGRGRVEELRSLYEVAAAEERQPEPENLKPPRVYDLADQETLEESQRRDKAGSLYDLASDPDTGSVKISPKTPKAKKKRSSRALRSVAELVRLILELKHLESSDKEAISAHVFTIEPRVGQFLSDLKRDPSELAQVITRFNEDCSPLQPIPEGVELADFETAFKSRVDEVINEAKARVVEAPEQDNEEFPDYDNVSRLQQPRADIIAIVDAIIALREQIEGADCTKDSFPALKAQLEEELDKLDEPYEARPWMVNDVLNEKKELRPKENFPAYKQRLLEVLIHKEAFFNQDRRQLVEVKEAIDEIIKSTKSLPSIDDLHRLETQVEAISGQIQQLPIQPWMEFELLPHTKGQIDKPKGATVQTVLGDFLERTAKDCTQDLTKTAILKDLETLLADYARYARAPGTTESEITERQSAIDAKVLAFIEKYDHPHWGREVAPGTQRLWPDYKQGSKQHFQTFFYAKTDAIANVARAQLALDKASELIHQLEATCRHQDPEEASQQVLALEAQIDDALSPINKVRHADDASSLRDQYNRLVDDTPFTRNLQLAAPVKTGQGMHSQINQTIHTRMSAMFVARQAMKSATDFCLRVDNSSYDQLVTMAKQIPDEVINGFQGLDSMNPSMIDVMCVEDTLKAIYEAKDKPSVEAELTMFAQARVDARMALFVTANQAAETAAIAIAKLDTATSIEQLQQYRAESTLATDALAEIDTAPEVIFSADSILRLHEETQALLSKEPYRGAHVNIRAYVSAEATPQQLKVNAADYRDSVYALKENALKAELLADKTAAIDSILGRIVKFDSLRTVTLLNTSNRDVNQDIEALITEPWMQEELTRYVKERCPHATDGGVNELLQQERQSVYTKAIAKHALNDAKQILSQYEAACKAPDFADVSGATHALHEQLAQALEPLSQLSIGEDLLQQYNALCDRPFTQHFKLPRIDAPLSGEQFRKAIVSTVSSRTEQLMDARFSMQEVTHFFESLDDLSHTALTDLESNVEAVAARPFAGFDSIDAEMIGVLVVDDNYTLTANASDKSTLEINVGAACRAKVDLLLSLYNAAITQARLAANAIDQMDGAQNLDQLEQLKAQTDVPILALLTESENPAILQVADSAFRVQVITDDILGRYIDIGLIIPPLQDESKSALVDVASAYRNSLYQAKKHDLKAQLIDALKVDIDEIMQRIEVLKTNEDPTQVEQENQSIREAIAGLNIPDWAEEALLEYLGDEDEHNLLAVEDTVAQTLGERCDISYHEAKAGIAINTVIPLLEQLQPLSKEEELSTAQSHVRALVQQISDELAPLDEVYDGDSAADLAQRFDDKLTTEFCQFFILQAWSDDGEKVKREILDKINERMDTLFAARQGLKGSESFINSITSMNYQQLREIDTEVENLACVSISQLGNLDAFMIDAMSADDPLGIMPGVSDTESLEIALQQKARETYDSCMSLYDLAYAKVHEVADAIAALDTADHLDVLQRLSQESDALLQTISALNGNDDVFIVAHQWFQEAIEGLEPLQKEIYQAISVPDLTESTPAGLQATTLAVREAVYLAKEGALKAELIEGKKAAIQTIISVIQTVATIDESELQTLEVEISEAIGELDIADWMEEELFPFTTERVPEPHGARVCPVLSDYLQQALEARQDLALRQALQGLLDEIKHFEQQPGDTIPAVLQSEDALLLMNRSFVTQFENPRWQAIVTEVLQVGYPDFSAESSWRTERFVEQFADRRLRRSMGGQTTDKQRTQKFLDGLVTDIADRAIAQRVLLQVSDIVHRYEASSGQQELTDAERSVMELNDELNEALAPIERINSQAAVDELRQGFNQLLDTPFIQHFSKDEVVDNSMALRQGIQGTVAIRMDKVLAGRVAMQASTARFNDLDRMTFDELDALKGDGTLDDYATEEFAITPAIDEQMIAILRVDDSATMLHACTDKGTLETEVKQAFHAKFNLLMAEYNDANAKAEDAARAIIAMDGATSLEELEQLRGDCDEPLGSLRAIPNNRDVPTVADSMFRFTVHQESHLNETLAIAELADNTGQACFDVADVFREQVYQQRQQHLLQALTDKARQHIYQVLTEAHQALEEPNAFDAKSAETLALIDQITNDPNSPVYNNPQVLAAAVDYYNQQYSNVWEGLDEISPCSDDSEALRDDLRSRFENMFRLRADSDKGVAEDLADRMVDKLKQMFDPDIEIDTPLDQHYAELGPLHDEMDNLADKPEILALFTTRLNEGLLQVPIDEQNIKLRGGATQVELKANTGNVLGALHDEALKRLRQRQIDYAKGHIDTILAKVYEAVDADDKADFERLKTEALTEVDKISNRPESSVYNHPEVVQAATGHYNSNAHHASPDLGTIDDMPRDSQELRTDLKALIQSLFLDKALSFGGDELHINEDLSLRLVTAMQQMHDPQIYYDAELVVKFDETQQLIPEVLHLDDNAPTRQVFSARVLNGIARPPISETTLDLEPGDELAELQGNTQVLVDAIHQQAKDALLARQIQHASDYLKTVGQAMHIVGTEVDVAQLELDKDNAVALIDAILDDKNVLEKEQVVLAARDAFNDEHFVSDQLKSAVKTRQQMVDELKAMLEKEYTARLAAITTPAKTPVAPALASNPFNLYGEFATTFQADMSTGKLFDEFLDEYGTESLFGDESEKFFQIKCDKKELSPDLVKQFKGQGITMKSASGLHYVTRLSGNEMVATLPKSQFDLLKKPEFKAETSKQKNARLMMTMVEMINQLTPHCRRIDLHGNKYAQAAGRMYLQRLQEKGIQFSSITPSEQWACNQEPISSAAKAFVDDLMDSEWGQKMETYDFFKQAYNHPDRVLKPPEPTTAPVSTTSHSSSV